jgi:endonuclease/exonuclease/phosphatase family metal-dependent hydrolase
MYKKIVIALMFGFAMSLKAQTYKAMTYNIRYDNVNDGENQWFKRKEFLTNQMAYNAPDILGIQEGLHHQVKYIDSVLTQYKYIGVGRDDGKIKGEYSAIFYDDRKLEVINQGTFWLSKTPEEISVGWDAAMERICTYGLFIDKTTDQQFFVFNTHFDHIGNMAREESAKLILKKATILNKNNLPLIIMRDFN